MITQKFSTPVQGARVQKSVQTKGNITVIVEPDSITVMVQKQRKIKTDYRKGVEL